MMRICTILKVLKGNFSTMGKEKDQVDQADLHVGDKDNQVLNQAEQKGYKISKELRTSCLVKLKNVH